MGHRDPGSETASPEWMRTEVWAGRVRRGPGSVAPREIWEGKSFTFPGDPRESPSAWTREKAFSDFMMRLRKSRSPGPWKGRGLCRARAAASQGQAPGSLFSRLPTTSSHPVISPERPRFPSTPVPEQRPTCAALNRGEPVCRPHFLLPAGACADFWAGSRGCPCVCCFATPSGDTQPSKIAF